MKTRDNSVRPGRIGGITRTAVNALKPTVEALVSMVGRHPEATVGAGIGYFLGKQVDRVWGVRQFTGGAAKYLLAGCGAVYGYNRALLRRQLDMRVSKNRREE